MGSRTPGDHGAISLDGSKSAFRGDDRDHPICELARNAG